MTAHLHEPDIYRLTTRTAAPAELPRFERHLSECRLCSCRLREAELRPPKAEMTGAPLDRA